MLFSRRKAEIEILANNRCAKDILGSIPESQASSISFDGSAGIPLIRYLVGKLDAAITQCRDLEFD